jgi:hypothetical protein
MSPSTTVTNNRYAVMRGTAVRHYSQSVVPTVKKKGDTCRYAAVDPSLLLRDFKYKLLNEALFAITTHLFQIRPQPWETVHRL